MALKTNRDNLRCLIIFLIISILPNISLSQETDTIVPVQQKPEKILRKMDIRKMAQGGFNFWQDDFSGHWAGFDFGFNTLLNPDYTGYATGFMKNDLFRSNSTYVNLIQQSVGLQHNRNTIGLVTGLGLHLQSYRLDKNTTIERLPDNTIEPKTLYFDENQKSKLSLLSLTVPLLAEFQIPINHYENRLYVSAGVFGSYRLSSHTKIKYRVERKEKLKVPDNYSLYDFKYGIMVRSGYRWINLFAAYDLMPLFKKGFGPELTPFTFGVTLLRF